MTDLERRLKRAKDATADAGASSEHSETDLERMLRIAHEKKKQYTADAGASSEHSETDLERMLRIAHEDKKQYTRSGAYRRNALQNRTESFMDIVTQGETEARAGIDRYKANRDADYYQQMNKAGATYRDQDMLNRSVTGYKGAYDLWKSAFDRETDAAAARTRREREMTENPAKAPTVSDIVSRYSGKTKTLADLGNNVRGAIDAYKRQSDAAKAAPTPEEARQQAEESVQYWQNVAREAARYGDVYRQATAKKHLADSVENYSRATKGYFDNLKNTDPGTYYALTMTPEEIDRELELLNNGAYLDSKITKSLTNDERIMGEYWHRTPQEQRQYEHNLERARFAGETDDERNAYISSEKEAYRDARNRMLNDASVEGSVGSNQEPYNRREEITQANEARKSVLENARLTQKVIQAERDGITNDPQIIASGKQKFEKDQDAIWDRWTVEQGWAETSPKMDNLGRAHEHGYVLDRMDEMTEEQRARIYSLYDRDPETALKLAQTYAKALDDKVYQEIFDWVAKDSGWQFGRRAVGNLAGAVMNLASGLDPFGYGGQSAGKVGDALIGGAAQSATRNGWFGIEELGGDRSPISSSVPLVGRGRAGEASQLVSSMEQSALTTLPALVAGRYDAAAASWLETAGLLLQSSSAARSDYRESIEAGLDDTTAKIHAVAAGIAEYTFEKVSFDKLLAQNTSRMTFKKVMKDVLVQAGIEGSEELHTTLANTIMDEIISGDGKSKVDRRIAELVQGGMSMKEAKGVAEKEWLTGIVNDFIGGAASGGIMTGAHYAVGATVNTAENKIANNAVNQLVGQYAGAQTENFTDADTIEAAKNYAEARGIDASGLTEAAAQARNASVDEAMSALRGSTQSETETKSISKRDSRKAGKAWTEIRTQISQDFDGKSGAQAAQLYDQMAEQYGAGIKTIVDEVVTTQARQSYLEQSQTAQELQQKVKPQVEALPEGGYKQASMRAYDQAEYQLRQQEAAKTADRLAKAGNIDTEVTYTNKDGSETTAQIADLSDDLTSVVLDNGETVPIKDVQMSADTASAIRIFSRIAGKKAASLAFREYRAYLNNGGTEGYRFAEAVATAYGQGLNGVLTPEQALKMAPDFAQEAAQRAFNAGRQKHQANIENEQARRKAAEEKAKAEGAQTVKGELRGVDSIKWEKLNATRRTRAQNQIKYLDSIAQGIGVDIELFQSEATRRGKRMAYRGEQGAWYVDKATGKPVIRIDVNAGANFLSDLNAALIATTGHELAHHFQHISPAVYDEYRQAVVQAILSTENGYEKLQRLIEHEKRINRKADGTTISTDEAIDEVVADASRDRVGDRNLWKNVADSMSDESRGKVAQWLHDRFSKILKLTKRYAGFEAADLVLQSAQEYQDLIGELWEKLTTQAATAVDVREGDYPAPNDVNNRTHGQNIKRNAARSVEETDAEYLELAKDPEENADRLQEMVDEAAKRAGYIYRRNTRRKLSAINSARAGVRMFVEGNDELEHYGRYRYAATGAGAIRATDIMDDLLQLVTDYYEENGMDHDGITEEWVNPSDIVISAQMWDDEDFVSYAWDNYFESIYDETDKIPAIVTDDGLIVFGDDNARIKSLDPITYDDQGNVIPLSERFNAKNEDIRYSEREDQSLRGRVSELEDQLDMAELNGLSQAEIRKLNNELIKARGQLDTYAANQRRQAKRTSFNEILRNLENYERVDLESLAEQISDSAWDDYDELSDEELIDALRETINERLEDFAPGEADDPKYGLFVKKPKTAGNISVVRNAARSVEETDAEYLELAKDPEKNADRLQEMVDYAARKAGYTNRAYHGTSAEFTAFSKGKIGSVFHKDKDGFFFTTDQNGAKYYASASTWAVRNGKAKVMDVVLKTKNPLIVESRIVSPVKYFDTHTEALIQKAKKGKRGVPYDSIIVTNDATSKYKFGDPDTERLYVVFEPEQIKSADPITYDDQGNVIPLSERFNEANEDIRFSERPNTDSAGRELSEGQQEYFKDSKIRDKYGNLLTLYHGTASDFTVFDLGRSGKNYDGWSEYGIGIYLTPDKKFATYFSESASQRGGTPKLMELYANIKNPFNVNDPVTVDVSEYAKKYKLTEDDVKFLKKSGDRWLAFMREHNEDIYDFLTSHGYDGLWDAYGTNAPTQIVAFTENQVKNVDNHNPTNNPDIRYSERDNAKPRSAQAQRDAGYKLSESKFYSLYSAHKLNMIGKGNVQEQISSIMADGFKGDGGFGNNVMPTNISYDVDENGKRIPIGLSAQKYAPKKGEYILLVPKEGVEVKGGRYNFTERVKPGYKPAFDYEIVRADYDGQPYYEMYERAYDKSQAGKADVTLDGAQFSQRDAAAISDMEIIESLDASEYTTPEIRNLVNEMKRKVETIRDYEDRLGKVRSEIDALDRETPATEKQKKKHDARLERLNGLAANLERKINEHTDILARKYRRIEGVRNVIDQARKKAIQKTRERKDAQFARSQEKRNERALRERIQRHAGDLEQKLLKPSDKRHIPEQYRLATTALLNAINRESGFDYDPNTLHTTSRGATVGKRVEKGKGTATKRTQAFLALKEALQRIAAEDGFTGELLDFDGDGSGLISQALALGDVPISKMNMEQLGTIWQTVRALEHNITNFNRAFAAGRAETISGIADKFRTDTEGRKPRQRDAKNALDAKQMKLFAMTKYLENPYTFFDHYGESGHEMFRRLRDAQDLIQVRGDYIAEVWLGEMRNALGVTGTDEKVRKAVEDFVEKTDKAVEVFTLQSGQKLTLTHSMMMDIWLLSQRAPTGLNHLLGSGVIQPKIDVKGHYTTRDATFRHLTIEDIQEIGSRLTEQEKATARAMQVVQRQLAKWGNEASMTVYGYRKFTEDNYWPVKNAREENKSESGQDNGRQATGTMNKGMARNLKPNAATGTEPVSAFRQLQGSISDMLTYSTWGPTLEDMNRVFNYKYKDESGATVTTVKSLVDQYGGEGSQRYWADLAKHISVGIGSSDNAIAAAIGKGVGAVKGARVAFNARVVVQQPTAYSRAAEVIDHKYLIASLGDLKSWSPGAKSAWNRALKYSPTARRKDSTTYDMGGSIRNDKALGLEKASAVEKFTDVGTALAGKADALTWGRLWHAAELQISAKTDLEKGSDEYYDAVNKLFTEAVDRTQVMDGILQRPAIMRMNSDFVKGMTAYMGEPLMQVNMLMRQAASWKQVGWKVAKKAMFRTASGLLLSQLINAMVQSVFDATFRRTDEDKDWWERFLAEMSGIDGTEKSAFDRITGVLLGGNLVSETTYLNKIPGINDLLSLIEGYDPGNDRFDLAAAKDLINAVKLLSNDKYTGWHKAKELVSKMTMLFGVGVGNALRDIYGAAHNSVFDFAGPRAKFDFKAIWLNPESKQNKRQYFDLLWQMLETGDKKGFKAYAEKLAGGGGDALMKFVSGEAQDRYENGTIDAETFSDMMEAAGADGEYIEGRFYNSIRELHEKKLATDEEAYELLQKWAGKDSKEAWDIVRKWNAKEAFSGDPDDFKWSQYDDLYAAIAEDGDILGVVREYKEKGYTDKQVNDNTKDGIRAALTGGSITENEAIDLLTRYVTYTKDGQAVAFDKDKAWKTVQEWQAKAENDGDPDYSYNQYDELFSAIDANKDVNGIVSELTAHGYDKDDVTKAVKGHLIDNYVAGKASETALKNQLSRYCGIVKSEDVNAIVTDAKCKRDTGYYPDKLSEGYRDGKVTKEQALKALVSYNGLSASEAKTRVRAWDFQKEHPDLKWDSDRVDAYYDKRPEGGGKSAYEAGISVETYDDYRNRAAKAKGVDANGDGRTDSGSKKAEILRIIDSLDLSRSQKDALYYINGWAASTIYEAPWH